MNYGRIFYCDIANGAGCRTALFVSGCRHHCKECFNPETWNFDYGMPYTKQTEDEIIASLDKPYVDGLSVLGGEPMEPENQPEVRALVERVKREYSDKNIWIYSGYTWEELNDPANARCHTEHTEAILACTDILVDGEFHIEEKNISLRFRGSENQRIIEVKPTIQKYKADGEIVLSHYMERVR